MVAATKGLVVGGSVVVSERVFQQNLWVIHLC